MYCNKSVYTIDFDGLMLAGPCGLHRILRPWPTMACHIVVHIPNFVAAKLRSWCNAFYEAANSQGLYTNCTSFGLSFAAGSAVARRHIASPLASFATTHVGQSAGGKRSLGVAGAHPSGAFGRVFSGRHGGALGLGSSGGGELVGCRGISIGSGGGGEHVGCRGISIGASRIYSTAEVSAL